MLWSAVGSPTRWPRTAVRAGRDSAPAAESTAEPGQGNSERSCVEVEVEVDIDGILAPAHHPGAAAYDGIQLTQRDRT